MNTTEEPGTTHPLESAADQAVCGRKFTGDTRYFPRSSYNGQILLFCTGYCQRAFLDDPQRFLQAHRRADAGQQDCEFLIEKDG